MPESNIVANADGSYTVTITVPAPVAAEPTEAAVQSAADTAIKDTFTPPTQTSAASA